MRDILYGTYPEDFFALQRQIRIRKIDEALLSLTITSNPHIQEKADREKLVNDLISRRRFMHGEDDPAEKLDLAAFETLRTDVQKKSKLVKAK